MKAIRALALTLALAIPAPLLAQIPTVVLNDHWFGHNEWSVVDFQDSLYIEYHPFFGNPYSGTQDTIIGPYTYKRYYKYWWWMNDTFVHFMIREDTLARKVYLWTGPGSGFSGDSLLYDYSLTVGDTIKGRLVEGLEEPLIISSVDSMVLGYGYNPGVVAVAVRRWIFSTGFYMQGIGSSFGFIEPYQDEFHLLCCAASCQSPISNCGLLYATEDTELISIFLPPCYPIISIGPQPKPYTTVKLHPNPSYGRLTVEAEVFPTTLVLLDPSGRQMCSMEVKTPTESTIDISHLPDGLYVAHLVSGSTVSRVKLIIQK